MHGHQRERLRLTAIVYEDGRSCLLLLLHGTLPVTLRQTTYNVPINIWLPQEYPGRPPLFFIMPAAGMTLRPGNYVDADKRCYHPYLAYWTEDVRKSVLIEAVRSLQSVFAKEFPVYAVSQQTSPSQSRNTIASPPVPSRPRTEHVRMNSIDVPPLPPPPPPVPAKPIPSGHSIDRSEPEPIVDSRRAPALQAKPSEWIPQASAASVARPMPPSSELYPYRQSQPQPQPRSRDVKPVTTNPVDLLSQDLATAENITIDSSGLSRLRDQVISQLQDRAHIMQQESNSKIKALRTEIDSLHELKNELESGLAQLNRTEASCISNSQALRDRTDKAKQLVSSMAQMGIPDIDECLVAQNVVYNQLYDLVTSNMALQDTLYTLGKALENERINLDTFLKV